MGWNKPRNVWQWLLLLTPTVAALAACWAVAKWMPPIPPLHGPDGIEVIDVSAHIHRVFPMSFYLITGLSFVLALVFTRGVRAGQRTVNVIFLTISLVLVNSSVAFAGCAFGGLLAPHQ
jgi:hypothetical protein